LLADPAGWMQLRHYPAEAQRLFGIPAGEVSGLSTEAFLARALAAMLDAAATDRGPLAIVDYAELPDAVWTSTAPLLGVAPDPAAVSAMREEARYYSKSPERRPFTGDPPQKRAVSDHVRALAAEWLDPAYRSLAEGRVGAAPVAPPTGHR
jgi:hypothetical protein